jgi:hypothetical protein
VLDNIKPSYFDGVEHASGIVVTEVFKMRHQAPINPHSPQPHPSSLTPDVLRHVTHVHGT